VTDAILSRQFGRATVLKTEIEERQRRKAREREEEGVEWSPRFFVGSVTPLGRPELTGEGEEALKKAARGEWTIEESKVLAS
jgi:oxysterol-binding protein-related protein 9/10/11